ncbi:MAG: SPOR domain-containing protein [Paracoccaceae bacterium]
MADIEYGESLGEVYPSQGFSLAGFTNFLGAVLSVTLIAGLAWWGYQLMVRDVSGVPVVQALKGPMRVAPDDPGGKSADYQGLAVNNIAAVGEAADPAEKLTLAPKPTALIDEDLSAGELEAMEIVSETSPEGIVAQEAIVAATTNSNAEADEPIAGDQATLIAAALQLAQEPEADTAAIIATPTEVEAIRTDVIPASVAGVSTSLVPQLRPATLVASLQNPSVMTDATNSGDGTAASIDPASIATGTRLVQLGAFPSPELADAEWAKLNVKFEDFMKGKSQVIQRAQSGGKVFFRLRAYGFEDLSDARRFCSALLAEQANCIPVVTR